MKDKLIELLSSCPTDPEGNRNVAVIAQHLLDNGVVVFDNDVVSPENRPLIQTVAGMPVNEVIGLVKAKQEGRIIVPPCKVGDTVYDTRAKKDNVAKGIPIPLQISAIGVTAYVWETWCGTPFDMKEIGKTVFLTSEAAEQAL